MKFYEAVTIFMPVK